LYSGDGALLLLNVLVIRLDKHNFKEISRRCYVPLLAFGIVGRINERKKRNERDHTLYVVEFKQGNLLKISLNTLVLFREIKAPQNGMAASNVNTVKFSRMNLSSMFKNFQGVQAS